MVVTLWSLTLTLADSDPPVAHWWQKLPFIYDSGPLEACYLRGVLNHHCIPVTGCTVLLKVFAWVHTLAVCQPASWGSRANHPKSSQVQQCLHAKEDTAASRRGNLKDNWSFSTKLRTHWKQCCPVSEGYFKVNLQRGSECTNFLFQSLLVGRAVLLLYYTVTSWPPNDHLSMPGW